MTDTPRLIERAFPLKQASLDSVHEKNVRHGHISTLHIWPARRPLAACRAALIATLLPDPGTPEKRQELCEKIGGRVVEKIERKKMPNGTVVERVKEETEGGILHWKRETENAETMDWFRQEIRKAYGGRAPKVLDPFAGGGAIPLEAMRLGCEATAVDINPVAWFILKCTLEYPQKLAGKKAPLPDFVRDDEDFMDAWRKEFGPTEEPTDADLAWHVRAWGGWVLREARKELAPFYPTYAEMMRPTGTGKTGRKIRWVPHGDGELRLVPLKDDGTLDIEKLNEDIESQMEPRWIPKPTVAYLWARTVKCKNCRATLPLLKTRWLCKKDKKRVLLTMEPNADKTGVVFGVDREVPSKGGNAAQKREHDKRIGAGTMSRAGASCPCCGTIMTMEDIRFEGKAGRIGNVMTAVVVDGQEGKEYRRPTEYEISTTEGTEITEKLEEVFRNIPFGLPTEPTPKGGNGASRAFSVDGYGFDQWNKLFNTRQLLAMGSFVRYARSACEHQMSGLSQLWQEAIGAYLAVLLDKTADYNSGVCMWHISGEKIGHTFTRFALPITWDFVELAVINNVGGATMAQLEWEVLYIQHALLAAQSSEKPSIINQSSKQNTNTELDVIVTDPPYYDAIPYSDCMDFFHVWIRRTLHGLNPAFSEAFAEPLSPKWNHETDDGEMIDDCARHDGNRQKSKQAYEDGMANVFRACHQSLKPEGCLVVVFAHKHPDAWETLMSAIIKSGFVADACWPIQTEMSTRMRAKSSAALSSSVWLVCKKRPITAKPGWDNRVLEDMRTNISVRLREYWDAGIRGPDFVWAATGPALEAYSKHPVVKKANDAGQIMTVGEFLTHVRRMVVDFVVGQVLTGSDKDGVSDMDAADRMDAPTSYYLLHRNDFGFDEAPSGACILYATACGLSDRDLETTWNMLARKGGSASDEDEKDADPDDDSTDESSDSGSKVKLKTWAQRNSKSMGYDAPGGQTIPLIDRVHRLMHLWKSGDVHKVDEYLDDNGLRRQELFGRLLQSLIELSPAGSEERSLLESLSNHTQAKGSKFDNGQMRLDEILD